MSNIKNREVFLNDPTTKSIPNLGVAKVINPETPAEWDVLRYELESFVCDGEYDAGLQRILWSFVDSLARPEQPAVWVSGFYGSGKSHLVRVLEYLWRDVELPDAARARALTQLPPDTRAQLIELSRLGAQQGGLWSAAGTLSAGATSIRLALLSIVFRSAGLPEQFPAARLVLWLKQEGCFDAVESAVTAGGRDINQELRNMWVSPALSEAVLEAMPGLAGSAADVRALFREQYPNVDDISDDDLRGTMREVLELKSERAGKLPLTLLVFDELQQFIAEDPVRTLQVQQVVEACVAQFGSHVLFVGTGQSALQATPQLSKLQGRFSVRVDLSDSDVEKVVREVVLRKSPDRVTDLEGVLDASSGEIDRHLVGTRIGPRTGDEQDLVSDYPLLPVRRRLWERVLRAVDSAGAAGQLRTQLRAVHEATREVADKPLGSVVRGDLLYWQLEAEMQQSAVLQRDMATTIRELDDGSEDGKLRSRLCALVFLIGQLPTEGPAATGVRATASNLSDLIVEDLVLGSDALRQRVPAVLDGLVEDSTLMRLDDEYRLQTEESAEWETDYRARYARISNDEGRVASERGTALREAVGAALGAITLPHGDTRTPRKFDLHFGSDAPSAETGNVAVWVRDEWSVSEQAVREDAQAAGIDDPTVYVFLPRLDASGLREAIARAAAAEEAVATRPRPETIGGIEVRESMSARAQLEQDRTSDLAGNIVRNARVFQGGGNELAGATFDGHVRQALEASLSRMFPNFNVADRSGWDRVFERAAEGAGDSMTAVGHSGDVDQHPVSQEVRTFVGGAGKKGLEVRRHFMAPPYGWPQDAVDGALVALLSAGFIRASRNGQPIEAQGITRPLISASDFFSEGVTVGTQHRIGVRSLASQLGLPVTPGAEAEVVLHVLDRLTEVAQAAGGEPPLPDPPGRDSVEQIRALAGNAQLVKLYEEREKLAGLYAEWLGTAEKISQRESEWALLLELLVQAKTLPLSEELKGHVEAIRNQRGLLRDPNPLPPLLSQLRSSLREAVSTAHERLEAARGAAIESLDSVEEWSQSEADVRARLIEKHNLAPASEPDMGTDDDLLASLRASSLEDWDDKVDAVPGRAARALEEAVQLSEPAAVNLRPRAATLRTVADVEAYVAEFRQELLAKIEAGTPVVIT
ncbi:MAG: BREX system P-loop protein BrxC [Chloroflexi bacterium]|nr:BREX system P-loop protein BrxC [Chloroflexota bacterium]